MQQGNGTDVRGNASVTTMLRHILSVSCAMRRECLSKSKRYTTRFLCQKVEHMTGATSSLCASRVTQGYTQREVTDGMEERVIHVYVMRNGEKISYEDAVAGMEDADGTTE